MVVLAECRVLRIRFNYKFQGKCTTGSLAFSLNLHIFEKETVVPFKVLSIHSEDIIRLQVWIADLALKRKRKQLWDWIFFLVSQTMKV